MKKITLLVIAMATFFIANGQIQSNEINSTGKVGVGTITPDCELDVVGHTHLDGTAEITGRTVMRDSVTIDRTLTIEEDLNVVGISTFSNDLILEAPLFFKQYEDLSLTEDRFVVMDKSGEAKAGGIADIIYSFEDCHITDKFGGGFSLVVPNWAYKPGVIHTGKDCPSKVGIRTDVPTA
ncbi:MAG: hypothetical protein JKY54_04065, partial [Flavobacteriales bacterium]|nr:hypothetical protein [Flavobacteriales bacterium]